ncbi:MAG: hypothetical protein AAB462_00750 [Patescibacteria group bacterium]|mgnify:CR=1 FL=1
MAENINNNGPENNGQNPPQNPDEFPFGNPHDQLGDQAPVDPIVPVDPNAPPATPFEAPIPTDPTTTATPTTPEDPNWVIADPHAPQDNANMPPVEGFPHGNPDDPTVENTAVQPDAPEGPEGPVDQTDPNDGQNDANGNNGGRFARFRRSRNNGNEDDANDQPTMDPNDPAVAARRSTQNLQENEESVNQQLHREARRDVDAAIDLVGSVDRPDVEYKIEQIEKIPWSQQRILESKFMQPGRIGRVIFPHAGSNTFSLAEYQTGEAPDDRRHQRYRVVEEMQGWLLPDVVRPRNNPTNGVATARSTSVAERNRTDALVVDKHGKKTFAGALEAHVTPENESQRKRTVAVGEDLDVLGAPQSFSNDSKGKFARLLGKDRQVFGQDLDQLAGTHKRITTPQHLPAQIEKLKEVEEKILAIQEGDAPQLFDPNPNQPHQFGEKWWDEFNAHAENEARDQQAKAEAQQEQLIQRQAAATGQAVVGALGAAQAQAQREQAITADYNEAHDINDHMQAEIIAEAARAQQAQQNPDDENN